MIDYFDPIVKILEFVSHYFFISKYTKITIEGWNVWIRKKLIKKDLESVVKAASILTEKLCQIEERIPSKYHSVLKEIVFWIDQPTSGLSCMVYHVSDRWLKEHGYNPIKAKSIEITDISRFIEWEATQPWYVLHELAHAYHHQVISYDYEPLIQAYQHAKDQGLYQIVQRNSGTITTAYAIKNVREYFAELSEAYFGESDFYPFNRQQLKIYDYQGYLAIQSAWNIPISAIGEDN